MGKYIHKFNTEQAFNARVNGENYREPWLSYTRGKGTDYNQVNYIKVPLTLEALGTGEIMWDLWQKSILYSKNGGAWQTMDAETVISVVAGDKIQFKGENSSYSMDMISATTQFNLSGNIMSLVYGDNFENANTLGNSVFSSIFSSSPVVSAKNLKLPSTDFGRNAYSGMFSSCTHLVEAPDLPSEDLALNCYDSMFYGCTSLVRSPVLPSTTLLTGCYKDMFTNCSSLNYVRAYFEDTPSYNSTGSWMSGVAEHGTFVKSSGAKWNVIGPEGVPEGWTIEKKPILRYLTI